jgi:hypothetical protein
VYDIWFDLQDGTNTVGTNCSSVYDLEALFFYEWNLLEQYCGQLMLPAKSRSRFLTLQWFFYSRSLVAFEQLKNLQGSASVFRPQQFTRKQLVCDMEQWDNRLRWISYFASKRF